MAFGLDEKAICLWPVTPWALPLRIARQPCRQPLEGAAGHCLEKASTCASTNVNYRPAPQAIFLSWPARPMGSNKGQRCWCSPNPRQQAPLRARTQNG